MKTKSSGGASGVTNSSQLLLRKASTGRMIPSQCVQSQRMHLALWMASRAERLEPASPGVQQCLSHDAARGVASAEKQHIKASIRHGSLLGRACDAPFVGYVTTGVAGYSRGLQVMANPAWEFAGANRGGDARKVVFDPNELNARGQGVEDCVAARRSPSFGLPTIRRSRTRHRRRASCRACACDRTRMSPGVRSEAASR